MKQARKPNAIVEIKTGEFSEKRGHPDAWDYGEVWKLTEANDWIPHPHYPGQHRSFNIELLSDVIEFNHQSHLTCYTGKTPFCFRPHRGLDEPGICRRRDPEGGIFLTECNPDRCAIRQNKLEPDSRAVEIFEKWGRPTQGEKPGAVYEYAKLVTRDKKGNIVTAKCSAYSFFIFNLLLPDGSYAHPEGEFAMLASKSDTTANRLTDKLRRLYVRCGGKIAGLRLQLVFRPVETRFGTPRPAWDLRIPEDEQFESARLTAAGRLQARSVDYSALPPDALSTALVRCHEPQHLAQWVADQYPDVVREAQSLALDRLTVQAEMIDPQAVFLINQHPTIQALIQRCQTSYAMETYLPKLFGTDINRCIEWYKEHAERKGIDISDIVGSTPCLDVVVEHSGVSENDAAPESEIADAEIVEPEPDTPPPSIESIEQAVRGQADPMVQDLKDILERP